MIIRFWGVRGSLPSPPAFTELKGKITQAVAQAVRERVPADGVEAFVDSLPQSITGFVGGNTPCLEISCESRILIFDAGSGIRKLGEHLTPAPVLRIEEEMKGKGKASAKGAKAQEAKDAKEAKEAKEAKAARAQEAKEAKAADAKGAKGSEAKGAKASKAQEGRGRSADAKAADDKPAKGAKGGAKAAKPPSGAAPAKAATARRHLDLLFTHTHWDHIQGFPFFAPVYDKDTSITIHAMNARAVEDGLRTQQSTPLLFPIHFDELPADIRFSQLTGDGLRLGPFTIDFLRLPHPGGSTAYRVKAFGRIVVFATDYELLGDSPEVNRAREDLRAFVQGADMFISDTQYTYLESHSKEGWGHSNALNVVEMAHASGVKRLYLFHHDPSNDDRKLYDMLEKASSYSELLFPGSGLSIYLATEGAVVEFPETPDGGPVVRPHAARSAKKRGE